MESPHRNAGLGSWASLYLDAEGSVEDTRRTWPAFIHQPHVLPHRYSKDVTVVGLVQFWTKICPV